MNNQVYYSDFYCKIYSIGMRIPNIYNYPLYYQTLVNLNKDENNQALIKQLKDIGRYGLEIETINHAFNKFKVLPDSLWTSNDKDEQPSEAEYIFRIKGGGIVMRENCANVFKQFRLGKSTLTPLKIYELETGNLWRDETFYFFNLCEHRQFITHSQSSESLNFLRYPSGKELFTTSGVNEIEIDNRAIDSDVDIWHDPMLLGSRFISSQLHDALVSENLYKPWHMNRCKII